MKKQLLVLFLGLTISISAFADFLIEPSIGYNIDSYELKLTGPAVTLPGAANGLGLGLKAGYNFTAFFAALDISYNMLSNDFESPSMTDGDASQTNIGIVGGVDLMMFRLWLGYIFSSSSTSDDTPESKFSEGSGFKVGAGYSILPMLSLNAEYSILSYDKMEQGGALVTNFDTFDHNILLISLSAPLSF